MLPSLGPSRARPTLAATPDILSHAPALPRTHAGARRRSELQLVVEPPVAVAQPDPELLMRPNPNKFLPQPMTECQSGKGPTHA